MDTRGTVRDGLSWSDTVSTGDFILPTEDRLVRLRRLAAQAASENRWGLMVQLSAEAEREERKREGMR